MKTQRPKSAPGRKVGGASSSGAGKTKGSRKQPPAPPAPHVPGHPCLTYELVDSLLNWIAGGRSLRSWCEVDGHPSHQVILRALREDEPFRTRYARAREDQADSLVDECLDIANDGRNDTYVDENGNVKVDNDVLQRSKLRCEERHWLAGKLRPKVYGERLSLDIEKTPTTDEIAGEHAALVDSLARLGFRRG